MLGAQSWPADAVPSRLRRLAVASPLKFLLRNPQLYHHQPPTFFTFASNPTWSQPAGATLSRHRRSPLRAHLSFPLHFFCPLPYLPTLFSARRGAEMKWRRRLVNDHRTVLNNRLAAAIPLSSSPDPASSDPPHPRRRLSCHGYKLSLISFLFWLQILTPLKRFRQKMKEFKSMLEIGT
jgi:hypothetical protein